MLAWGASTVAAAGLISLGSGLEVMPVAAAGPLAMPIGLLVAGAVMVGRIARTRPAERLLWLECLLLTILLIPAGLTVTALVAGGPGAALRAAFAAVSRPFVGADALLAALTGLLVSAVLSARDAGAGRPRWPWERDDEP